jgi:hypothetical protein
MPKSKPPVPLAKWYSFPADSCTRAFITPHIARLRVVGDPENIMVITRQTTYTQWGGEYRFELPGEGAVCYGIGMRRSDGSHLLLQEGAILQFAEGVLARLDAIHNPYWRRLNTPLISTGPSPDAGNALLSYLQLTFLEPDKPADYELQTKALVLTPVDTLFD